jgi:hypothetical protein
MNENYIKKLEDENKALNQKVIELQNIINSISKAVKSDDFDDEFTEEEEKEIIKKAKEDFSINDYEDIFDFKL